MEKDLIDVANDIRQKVAQLENARNELQEIINFNVNAQTKMEYDKTLAITILKLKAGVIKEFEGQQIKDLTAGERPLIAKGVCWREKLAMDTASEKQKLIIEKIKLRLSQLTALQSVFRHLSEI